MVKKKTAKKSSANGVNAAVNFFAEAGLLKRIKRSGWWVAGIDQPESVAEHCFRTAVMGYFIAHLEKADVSRVMAMALFNDIHESRINDLHKMGHYYIDFKEAERKVFRDQVKDMPPSVRRDLESVRREYEAQKTKESVIARDADILECLQQAKEYYEHGHPKTKLFFRRAPSHLKTRTARRIWTRIKTWDSHNWWMNVVKFER